jgi:hypothetical protein
MVMPFSGDPGKWGLGDIKKSLSWGHDFFSKIKKVNFFHTSRWNFLLKFSVKMPSKYSYNIFKFQKNRVKHAVEIEFLASLGIRFR